MKINIDKFKNRFNGLILLLAIFCFIIPSEVRAFTPVTVANPTQEASDNKNWLQSFYNWTEQKGLVTAGSKALQAAISNALNTIAYDTATWIGSGGKGQKPLFITEDWGTYLANVGDNAVGTFIEKVGGEWNFNLCEPDLAIKVKIGLGLKQYSKPSTPSCTFSDMVNNWEEELQREDFLGRFQDMFEPSSNDLGIALSLHTGVLEEKQLVENKERDGLIAKKGWLDVRGIDGKQESVTDQAVRMLEQTGQLQADNLAKFTGDAFIDAANVFLNQLAITAFNNLMSTLGNSLDETSSSYSGDYGGLSDADSQKTSSGASGLKDKLRTLIEPSFATRGDYDILAELSICPDPDKAGPTNCVITEKFRQAISEKKTVWEAMAEGYLNSAGIFGFTSDNLEPSHNDENYPYRSMIILRKFRILPVGWEVAAQYIKENSSVGTRNLEDLVACFDSEDEYEGYEDTWCDGLVDPNWVLKAPLNYCKREGAGPEITNEQITGSGDDSELIVSRNENYCADEQSCIKENSDGSCQLYGYCTEERRKWDLGTNTCEPRNNTCQTFRGGDGNTVSYLENTLDYSDCSADYAGCKAYSLAGTYSSGSSTVSWSNSNLAYFDNDAKTCTEENEGCYGFLRVKSGVNLFVNSGFEDSLTGTVWENAGTVSDDAYEGAQSLQISGMDKTIEIGPSDYSVGGRSFTLSFYAKDCGYDGELYLDGATSSLVTSSIWNRYSISYLFSASTVGNKVQFGMDNVDSNCKIDAIELEFGETVSDYSDYGDSGMIYQKFLPKYLENSCYNDPGTDYSLKSDAPSVCDNFVRQCNVSEEGCEQYTSASDGTSVTAKTVMQDYCPSECVGYDTYIQSETTFDSLRDEYFIPSSVQTCGAESSGCDEFTNLDKVSQGGEGVEYYSYLRQCIKPDSNNCSEFYVWEGSDEAGYQLKVMQLKKDASNNPVTIEDDSAECNSTIYSLPSTDSSYNSDCREFYNNNGAVSYHLLSYTVSCSDSCYPYRRTKVNTDPSITDQASCGNVLCSSSSSDGQNQCWNDKGDSNSANDECVVCRGGGAWDYQAGACVFMAIPDEGVTCSAANNGCREYSGNTGNNVEVVLNNDFEGTTHGWSGSVALSSEALTVGGNSLLVSNTSSVSDNTRVASTSVYSLVEKGKSYNLKFIAKPGGGNGFTKINSISLINGSGSAVSFVSGLEKKSDDWQIYEVNLAELDHDIDSGEMLEIKADGNIYIDDVKLTEIADRYYLIQNSWSTPDSCNEDSYGNPYPLYMLGCDAYSDRDNSTNYIHSFSNLCQESAVGCELMIDTKNSSAYNSETFTDMTVSADEYKYVVYDKDKQCSSSDKGCSRLGESYQYDGSTVFSDVYLKNNPDNYSTILCSSDNVGCEEWTTGDGTNYFKDPGDEVCEWRQPTGQTSYGWYKKQVNRCDTDSDGAGDGDVCLSDSDCSSGQNCKTENSDTTCSTSYLKTVGYGGAGNAVEQPSKWAGMCSASESGCTELIDPVSKPATNMIFNADFSQDVDNMDGADGWNGNDQDQDITLEPNALYILAVEGSNTATISLSNGNLYELKSDNSFGASASSLKVSSTGDRISKRFYANSSDSTDVSANISVANTNSATQIELKEAIIDYILNSNLDKTSCNGLVNFEDGCVLFNERVQNGSSPSGLVYDADLAFDDGQGVSPKSGDNDSNIILKASPDRVCDKWLACRSMAAVEDANGKEENVCFDIGLCNSVDDNGSCNGFVASDPNNKSAQQPVLPGGFGSYNNLSGYNKVGYSGISDNTMKGLYPLGEIEQKGEMSVVSNGGFEYYGDNYFPTGWTVLGSSGAEVDWDESMMKVINNPIGAQTEGIDDAPEGKSFLKMGASYQAISEGIEVVSGADYVLTAYIDTENLKSGEAQILVDGKKLAFLGGGNKWAFTLAKFTANSSLAKITLKASGSGITGNYYFDNIKLRPAAETRSSWYAPQTCRLYPESDSLSCEYYDDSGKYQKGWYGYCLEYDRAPGDPNACLLWWPVDKVKGDGIEEGAGYSDRFPLYYCAEAVQFRPVEKRKDSVSTSYDTCDHTPSGTCPTGYSAFGTGGQSCGWGDSGDTYTPGCQASGQLYYDDGDYGWYDYDGLLTDTSVCFNGSNGCVTVPAESGVKFYDSATGNLYDDYIGYCNKFVQVVTSIGKNKFWAGRVYEGSSYEVPNLKYTYEAGYTPFGGAVQPSPSNNPYEWDGEESDSDTTIQPIFIRSYASSGDYANSINSGSPYNFIPLTGLSVSPAVGLCSSSRTVCFGSAISGSSFACPSGETCDSFPVTNNISSANSLVSRLFGQSYGDWYWDSSQTRYVKSDSYIWGPPTTLCSSGTRGSYPADYCAIAPKVTNIKVASSTTTSSITKTGFVNLTFNSTVDSQQLPLVMYAVDWGDNENTTVSGVEMSDRQNADNPHSLYHLYDYWDLKAKDASGLGNITCGSDTKGNYCSIQPKAQIKDNWGWCNGGTKISGCDQWTSFGGSVKVYEK